MNNRGSSLRLYFNKPHTKQQLKTPPASDSHVTGARQPAYRPSSPSRRVRSPPRSGRNSSSGMEMTSGCTSGKQLDRWMSQSPGVSQVGSTSTDGEKHESTRLVGKSTGRSTSPQFRRSDRINKIDGVSTSNQHGSLTVIDSYGNKSHHNSAFSHNHDSLQQVRSICIISLLSSSSSVSSLLLASSSSSAAAAAAIAS